MRVVVPGAGLGGLELTTGADVVLIDTTDPFAADKADFGSSRVQRWFGRTWS